MAIWLVDIVGWMVRVLMVIIIHSIVMMTIITVLMIQGVRG